MNTDAIKNWLGIAQNVTSEYRQLQKLIAEVDAQIRRVESLPCTADEQIAETDRQLDELDAYQMSKINPGTDPSNCMIVPTISSAAVHHTVSPQDNLAFEVFSTPLEVRKAHIAKRIRAIWPKECISAKDRKAELTKLNAKKRQLAEQEEAFAVTMEAAGMRVTRRADLDPAVYLEFKDANHWNRKKLDDLWASISAERNRTNDINDEIRVASSEELTFLSLFERSETTHDKQRFERTLAEKREKKKELIARRTTVEEAINPLSKLHNNCLSFLKTHGVDVGSTVATIVRRAG